MLISRKNF